MTEQTPPAAPPADEAKANGAALPDQSTMSAEQLAQAILARRITRPRIASVRRLAEALLAKKAKKKKAGKKPRKADKKVRKLALIPGNKGR